jgi:hypothetical protein
MKKWNTLIGISLATLAVAFAARAETPSSESEEEEVTAIAEQPMMEAADAACACGDGHLQGNCHTPCTGGGWCSHASCVGNCYHPSGPIIQHP